MTLRVWMQKEILAGNEDSTYAYIMVLRLTYNEKSMQKTNKVFDVLKFWNK